MKGHRLEVTSVPGGFGAACACGNPDAIYKDPKTGSAIFASRHSHRIQQQHHEHLQQVRLWPGDVIEGGDDGLPAGLAGTCIRVLAILDYPATATDVSHWLNRYGKQAGVKQVSKALHEAEALSLTWVSGPRVWQLTVHARTLLAAAAARKDQP